MPHRSNPSTPPTAAATGIEAPRELPWSVPRRRATTWVEWEAASQTSRVDKVGSISLSGPVDTLR